MLRWKRLSSMAPEILSCRIFFALEDRPFSLIPSNHPRIAFSDMFQVSHLFLLLSEKSFRFGSYYRKSLLITDGKQSGNREGVYLDGKADEMNRGYFADISEMKQHGGKELHEVTRKSAALQMQEFSGVEKNDLLDYLRSLQPEKVGMHVEQSEAGVVHV